MHSNNKGGMVDATELRKLVDDTIYFDITGVLTLRARDELDALRLASAKNDAEIERLKTSLSVSAACLDDERTKVLKLKADLAELRHNCHRLQDDIKTAFAERGSALARAEKAEAEAAKFVVNTDASKFWGSTLFKKGE